MKFVRFIKNLTITGFIFCLLALLILRFFSQEIKSFNYRFFLVQSGSMEPAIMTGDIILVEHLSQYKINDVITFSEKNGRIVTHRIIDEKNNQFVTKGDANRIEDNGLVNKSSIIGKTILVIPKIGYFVDFSKSLNGLLFFIIVPSFILIISQLIHFGK